VGRSHPAVARTSHRPGAVMRNHVLVLAHRLCLSRFSPRQPQRLRNDIVVYCRCVNLRATESYAGQQRPIRGCCWPL
jgi:hypothetical protein